MDGFSLETVLGQLDQYPSRLVSVGPKILSLPSYSSHLSILGLEPILSIVGPEPKGIILVKKFPGGFHGRRFRVSTPTGQSIQTLSQIIKDIASRDDRKQSVMNNGSAPSYQVKQGYQKLSPRRLVSKAEQRFLNAIYEDDENLNELL